MGAIDHGTQTITFQYFLEATGAKFGKRLLDVLPPGIYSGGYLTKVTDSEVTLSALVAEIRDVNNQINVRTAFAATLNDTTLNTGAISSATPYLVLRWDYALSSANYVDVHAISSVDAALENDIIIGKCVFAGSTLTGFDYTDRTLLNVQNLYLKVETASGLYVRVRAGRMHTTTGYVNIPEQLVGPFNVPGGGNSRIDLVYVDNAGAIQILQGTQAVDPVAPAYNGKIVLAQIRIVNGDTSIPLDRITDVRTFIRQPSNTLTYDSGWFPVTIGTTYTKAHGLGAEPFMVQLWLSDSADGSGRVLPPPHGRQYLYGMVIKDVDSSNVYIRAHQVVFDDVGSATSGYARIKAILFL